MTASPTGSRRRSGPASRAKTKVVEQLVDLQRHALDYARRDGLIAEDEAFYAEQNARSAKDAEEYYRTMFGGPDPHRRDAGRRAT
jgi:hypothetical protein